MAWLPLWAVAETEVSAFVDSTLIGPDNTVVFTIRIANAEGNISEPSLSALKDFRVVGSSQSSRMSIVNFQVSKGVDYQYTLLPNRTGKLKIPSLSIQVGSQHINTKAIDVEVRMNATRSSVQTPSVTDSLGRRPSSSQSDNKEMAENLFLISALSKNKFYVGEAISLKYHLYSRYSLSGLAMEERPEFHGFVAHNVDIPESQSRSTVVRNGKKFSLYRVEEKVLYPAVPGTHTLKPMLLQVDIITSNRGGGFFGAFFDSARRVFRRSPILNIEVLSLPLPQPEGFTGAVGNFKIRSELAEKNIQVGDLVSYKIILEGTGNLDQIAPPQLRLSNDFVAHEPEITKNITLKPHGLTGSYTVTFILVPQVPGTLEIPSLLFPYFDPIQQSYISLELPQRRLQVEGSALTAAVNNNAMPDSSFGVNGNAKREIKTLITDIRYIKPTLDRRKTSFQPGYLRTSFYLGMIAPVMLWLAVWGALTLRDRKMGDLPRWKSRKAFRTAQRAHRQVLSLYKQGQSDTALENLESLLFKFIAAKAMRSASGLSLADIAQEMERAQIQKILADKLMMSIQKIQAIRYASGTSGDMAKYMKGILPMVKQIDRMWREQ